MTFLENVIGLDEAAQIVGLSEDRMRALIRAGELCGRQVGKRGTWVTTIAEAHRFRDRARRGPGRPPAGS